MLTQTWPGDWSMRWINFTMIEMECKCGCGSLPDPLLMDQLQLLRSTVGFALPATSGARCPVHDKQVYLDRGITNRGGTGPHTTGLAVDLGLARANAWEVNEAASVIGGWYGRGYDGRGTSRFLHLDIIAPDSDPNNPRPALWSY